MRRTERPDMPWQTNWDLRHAAWWCYTLRARYPLYVSIPPPLVFRMHGPLDAFDMPPAITVWCGPEAFLPEKADIPRPFQINTWVMKATWDEVDNYPEIRDYVTENLVEEAGLKAAWLYEGIPWDNGYVLLIWKAWR